MFGGGGYEGGGYGDGMAGGFQQGGFSSPSGGGDRQKSTRSQNIVPMTTKDVTSLNHDGNGFFMGETEVGQVTIVGIIVHVDKSQTSVTYTVDDGTSPPVSIKHWYAMDSGGDEDGEPDEQETHNEGTYIRVYAQIRSFQNKIALSALKIKPIEDMNELTTHILECIKFKMMIEKKKGAKPNTATNSSGGFMNQNAGSASGLNNMGMNKKQNQVYELIRDCDDESGIAVQDLQSSLKEMNAMQIKSAIEFLSNEGHIYSTVDDEHFKSTG